jgi:3-oxoadipate enol-lactonase
MEGKTRMQVNGYEMAYEDRGKGLPVLFIHGYPLNRELWQPQVDGLSGSGRILALDLRGHGDSQAVNGPYSMDLLASDCIALLNALEIRKPIVVCGLSMGGYVALALYRNYPERLDGLILAATRANADSPEGKANRDAAASLAKEKGVEAVVESMLPKMMSPKTYQQKPELVQRAKKIMEHTSLEGALGDLMGMKERPDSRPTLGTIDIPTLVIHGADDQIISAEETRQMHSQIQGAVLETVPEAGHLLNLEQPEIFNQAVKRFIQPLSY